MPHCIAHVFELLLRLLSRGDEPTLPRPYVLTPAELHERRLQRRRRRALWLAVHGIDAGPRRIHGVEVTA